MKILVAGDFCPRDRVARILEKGDYASVFGDIRDIVASADYSVVNFECPITTGYTNHIDKVGPNLKCSESGMDAIKKAGFKCVSLANNHFYDYGDEGVVNTLEACRKYGVDYVGGGINLSEASKTLFKQIGNQRIAIINCCEHEFSISTSKTGGSNPLNPIQQYYAIKEAKEYADYILVIVHGGHEHWQLPSPRMVETYRFFVDAGADAVVNHHQHCYSGYELYKGKPIFYGIGNFCFDRQGSRNNAWNEGFMVMIDFGIQVRYECYPYRQCDVEPKVSLLPTNAFELRIKKLNAIITDERKLKAITEDYYQSCTIQYSNIFEPIRNRYLLALRKLGLLPSLISKKRKLQANNFITCESHRDKIIWYLCH